MPVASDNGVAQRARPVHVPAQEDAGKRTHAHTHTPVGAAPPRSLHLRIVRGVVSALVAVILAPLVLSSAHLFEWAGEPIDGLGLPILLAWVPIVALDAAAATCVGMVTVAALRGEKAGGHHFMTWLIAGGSAAANLVYGQVTPARFDEWAFPAFSLLGPLLLDLTLALVRRWFRIDTGLRRSAAKVLDFGIARWMPWVATGETFAAWQTAQREGIGGAEDAIARTREVRQLKLMAGPDAMRFAFSALGGRNPYTARVWLASRGVHVLESDVELALKPRDAHEVVLASPDGVTAAEVAQLLHGSDETETVERVRRELEAGVGMGRLGRDDPSKGGRSKVVRYRAAAATETVGSAA